MRTTVAFWFWFLIAVISLGRLWSTLESGVLAQATPVDGLALVMLATALFLIGRAQHRATRVGRR